MHDRTLVYNVIFDFS